jgi:hypothetical protein
LFSFFLGVCEWCLSNLLAAGKTTELFEKVGGGGPHHIPGECEWRSAFSWGTVNGAQLFPGAREWCLVNLLAAGMGLDRCFYCGVKRVPIAERTAWHGDTLRRGCWGSHNSDPGTHPIQVAPAV